MNVTTTEEGAGMQIDQRAEQAIEKAQHWTKRAVEIAQHTAERAPAAVVVLVGGTVLLVTDAFGIGEVVTAGVVAYGAYRLLRRRAQRRAEAQ